MKKIMVSLLVVMLLVGVVNAGEKFRMGFAFYNLSNPVWAEVVSEAARYGSSKGIDVTYVDAGGESAKQISQIENFIQSGMNAICINAVDVTAVEPIAKEAMDKGIYIIHYTTEGKNTHTILSLDPVKVGSALVGLAEKWITAKYGANPTFKWGFLDITANEVGILEGKAVEAEMDRVLPNNQRVANLSTLTIEEGIKNTDAILQANPDLRVILSLSAGGGVGGNESIKSAISPDQYDDYGLFSIDSTEEEVLNIIRRDPQKGSISLGTGAIHGRLLVDYAADLLNGKQVNKINYLPIIEVTQENAQQYYDEMFKK